MLWILTAMKIGRRVRQPLQHVDQHGGRLWNAYIYGIAQWYLNCAFGGVEASATQHSCSGPDLQRAGCGSYYLLFPHQLRLVFHCAASDRCHQLWSSFHFFRFPCAWVDGAPGAPIENME